MFCNSFSFLSSLCSSSNLLWLEETMHALEKAILYSSSNTGPGLKMHIMCCNHSKQLEKPTNRAELITETM